MKNPALIVQSLQRQSHFNWAFLDQALVSGVNFLTGFLIARFLGLEQFGHFSILWLLILFLGSLQLSCIMLPMLNLASKYPEEQKPQYYTAVFIQQLLFAGGSIVMMLALLYGGSMLFSDWPKTDTALPLAMVVLFTQLQDFMRRYFFSTQQPLKAFISDFISYFSQFLVLVWLFMNAKPAIESVLWAMAWTSCLALVWSIFQIQRFAWDKTIFQSVLARHWDFSRWASLSTILQWGGNNLIVMISGALLGASSVGAIRATQNILGVTNILFLGLNNVIPVKLSEHFAAHGLKASEQYLMKITWMGCLGILLICLPAIFFPNELLNWFYGKEYEPFGWIMGWFITINFVIFVNQMVTYLLNVLEKPKAVFWSYLVSTILSIVLAYPLITAWGLWGAIIGMVITCVVRIVILGIAYQQLKSVLTRESDLVMEHKMS